MTFPCKKEVSADGRAPVDSRTVMFCWTPESDQAALVPWPDTKGVSFRYACSALACWASFHDLTFEQRKTVILSEAIHAIVGDRVTPDAVHRALLPLAEYRDAMADDMPGMWGGA